jgi:hypothetical protein
LLSCVSQYWDLLLPWVRTGPAIGVTFGMTESTAVPTGAIGVLISVTLLATGINCGATFAMGITGLLATSAATSVVTSAICEATAATCAPTVATSGTTAEIFEGVTGKEFDRSYFEDVGLTAAATTAAVSAF